MLTKPKRRLGCVVIGMVLIVALVLGGVFGGQFVEVLERYNYPQTYKEEVEKWAAEYNVDTNLVYTIIRTESGFKPMAESSAGARGLMQMTEETFEWLKQKIAADVALSFEDLYTPEVAIRFGTYYLSISLAKYGNDVSTAAAAYHSGWGTVDRLLRDDKYTDGENVLKEFPYSQMGHYVNKVNKSYTKYRELYPQ